MPESGLDLLSVFWHGFWCFCAFKAVAAWQHYNYLVGCVHGAKRVLRLNLDETSLCFFQGNRKGNVFISKKEPSAAQRVSLSTKRTFLSHIGIICDDPLIQPVLPQVILGNTRTIPAGQFEALRAGCASNVFLERENSAWNNGRVMRRVLRYLRRALGPYMGHVQPILIMDAHGCHTTADVIAQCRVLGIWPVVVPAKLTWLLQPLDTHGFAAFKAALRKCFQSARIRSLNGVLDLAGFLRCVEQAVREVFQGRLWGPAFDGDGFGNQQADVSRRVQTALELLAPPVVPSTRPTMVQLRSVFPRGVVVPPTLLPHCPAAVHALRLGPRLRPPVYGPAPALWLSLQ